MTTILINSKTNEKKFLSMVFKKYKNEIIQTIYIILLSIIPACRQAGYLLLLYHYNIKKKINQC